MQLKSWDITHEVFGSCVEVVVRGRSIVHQATQQTGTKQHHGNLMCVFRSIITITTTITTTTKTKTKTTTTTTTKTTLTSDAVSAGSRVSNSLNPRNFLS